MYPQICILKKKKGSSSKTFLKYRCLIGYSAESSVNHITEQNCEESRGSSQLTFQQQLQNEGPKLGNQRQKEKMVSQGPCKLALSCSEKPASSFLENHVG